MARSQHDSTWEQQALHAKVDHILTLLKEIHGLVSAGSMGEQKASRIPPWVQESGRMLLRGVMSLAAPVLWAWLTWIGAGVVLGYKLAVRFIIGS